MLLGLFISSGTHTPGTQQHTIRKLPIVPPSGGPASAQYKDPNTGDTTPTVLPKARRPTSST
ncbi:hypothetical protein P691DRAFT_808767 [Macrolepiota fuliginosa MF-IS2]|uniref:Uncharacterized protein n=1 Tax=Macrolepiota fuliginosa MF-IS2 TaxID=1400762 RepID=A0A9P6C799_9AGAR|nr:hypothetical protein P691DRAFT_808767 [Macrolepiota fuliginosa MF-IS2]